MDIARIDDLPALTPREAYLALVEFLRMELELSDDPTVDLRALIAEMNPEPSGTSADPGGVQQFIEAVLRVRAAGAVRGWTR